MGSSEVLKGFDRVGATGVKAPVDWQQFIVDDAKVFLFHTAEVKAAWEGDAALKDAAYAKWASPDELQDPPPPAP